VTTREELLLVGERLFAEAGVDGVSLRQISAAAGQGNNNAVQYHFGSKAGLVQAILEHRRERVDLRRFTLIAAARASGRMDDPRTLVEAMLLPLAEELRDPDSRYLTVLSQNFQFWSMPGHPMAEPFHRAFGESASGIVVAELLRQHLHDLPEPIRSHRSRAAWALFVHVLADRERAEHDDPDGERISFELLVADLIDAGVALITAPPSGTVLALMHGVDVEARGSTENGTGRRKARTTSR
jgi:AcrR family transcriptional regulator